MRLPAALLLAVLASAACAPAPAPPVTEAVSAGQTAVVVRVVDGDTLRVTPTGPGPLARDVEERVRLLEVDTPEAARDGQAAECGADAATARLAALTPPGSTVTLEADREDRDRFDRALRYVYGADGTFVNLALVTEGLAEAVLVGGNDRHIDRLRAAQGQARAAGLGIWGSGC